MSKQVILVVLAFLLTGQVEGKEIDRPTLLLNLNRTVAVDTMAPLQVISLRDERSDLHQIIIPYRRLTEMDRPDAVIDPGPAAPGFLNVFQMIQGQVAGVWVSGTNNDYRVRVRGALEPPLVIIDGMIFRGFDDQQLNNLIGAIPPADVDYIEVLKSISQTAIYGPGAGNGVLIVHTKRGGPEDN